MEDSRIEFNATGGDYFGFIIVRSLLVIITLGIYILFLPSAIKRWVVSHVYIDGKPCHYQDSFIDSLVHGIKSLFLTIITLGIYTPWAIAANIRYFKEHCATEDGRRFTFTGTGGQVFGKILLTVLLLPFVLLTFGLLGLWLRCKWKRWEYENTLLSEEGIVEKMRPSQAMKALKEKNVQWANMGFRGTMESLAGKVIIGNILSMITLGLYRPWFSVSMWKWEYENAYFLSEQQ